MEEIKVVVSDGMSEYRCLISLVYLFFDRSYGPTKSTVLFVELLWQEHSVKVEGFIVVQRN